MTENISHTHTHTVTESPHRGLSVHTSTPMEKGVERGGVLHPAVAEPFPWRHGHTADPRERLTVLEASSSESDAEARAVLGPLIKKDFLVLLPKNFLFLGERMKLGGN